MATFAPMASDSRLLSPSVLMLTTDRQIDRRILLQADSLQEAGWHVRILAMPADSPLADDARVIRIGSGANHRPRRESLVLSVYRSVRRHLAMNGWPMRLLKQAAWRFAIDQEKFYLRLFLTDALRMRADVIVAHDLPMLAVARTVAETFGAHLVYDSHELYCEQEFPDWLKRRWARIESRHVHACRQVITVNASIARELERRYRLDDVEVIHNAERIEPDLRRGDYLRHHFGLTSAARILLYQGGLSAGRNLEQLVSAMALVDLPHIHLVLLGDGQLGEQLQRRISRLGLRQRVHLHRAVAQRELLEVTASADAGIIPYQATCLNNLYCTPNKLFEFIAAGIPILASDLPELRRLIDGNGIGQVGDLSSPPEIAAQIMAFFAQAEALQTWKGRLDDVRRQISWQQEGERLKQIYEKLK